MSTEAPADLNLDEVRRRMDMALRDAGYTGVDFDADGVQGRAGDRTPNATWVRAGALAITSMGYGSQKIICPTHARQPFGVCAGVIASDFLAQPHDCGAP